MTRAFHRLQTAPNSCVCAALSSALAACGVEASEAALLGYVGPNLFDHIGNLLRGLTQSNPDASWVTIPWLGVGSRGDSNDPSYAHGLRIALADERVACVVLEVPFLGWLGFVEGRGMSSPYGSGGHVGQHHAVVVFGAGRNRARLLDPWSNPEGQPLELSLDDLLELAPVGILHVVREMARLPCGEADRFGL